MCRTGFPLAWLCALIALVVLALPVAADDDVPLRRLLTEDEGQAWNAVGRVDMAGAGFCTGALISPLHVLTAAHCLYYSETAQLIPPERIVFRAGWRQGRAAAVRRARRLIVHQDYNFSSRDKMRRVATDIALIELDRPIPERQVQPFEFYHSPMPGQRVMVVSYARDREDAPSLQERCYMLDDEDDVLVYSCDVNYGASGSPIFVISDARPKIASVVSAMAQWRRQDVALGASLGAPLQMLLNRLAATDPVLRRLTVPRSTASGPRRPTIAEQLGRSSLPTTQSPLPQISR